MTSISGGAFSGCSSLTSITIPDSVTNIGEGAFYDCSSLTSIIIPDSVTSIWRSAFYGCTSLTIMCQTASKPNGWDSYWNDDCPVVWDCNNNNVADDGYVYAVIDGLRYGLKDNIAFVAEQPSNISEEIIVIPSSVEYNGATYSVTSIADYTFYNCSSLTSVTIPDSVTSIGSYAFWYCTSLTSITIPDSVTSIGYSAFEGCSSLTIYCEDANQPSGWYNSWNGDCPVVWDCNNNNVADDGYVYAVIEGLRYGLKDNIATVVRQPSNIPGDIVIPSSVEYNGTTYSVTSIGKYAFYGCSSLTSITIPDSVTSIGRFAFRDCSSLKGVYITDIAAWCAIDFGDSSSNSSANPLDYADNLYLNGELVTNLVIPEGVTSIGNYAFYGCSSLTSITIPDSVTSIGNYAFSYCTSLESITIGNGVTSIGDGAFASCTNLTSVTIGNSVTSIGDWAFSGCTGLTSITIPDSVTSIGIRTFSGCINIITATMPAIAIGYIPQDNLRTVTITSGESIGDGAFRYCSSLTSITIPYSVTFIGEGAFDSWNSSLKTVYYAGSEEDWQKIDIASSNSGLTDAEIIYNYGN